MDPAGMLAAFLAAGFAGLIGALLGIGGGSVMVPTFIIFLGMDAKIAVATSLAALIATSAISSSVYLRKSLVNLNLAVVLEGTTVIGSIIGASIATLIPSWSLETIFGVVLAYTFAVMIHRTLKPPTRDYKPDPHGRFVFFDESLGREIRYSYRRTGPAASLSFLAGMASGMLGIGGGVIKVPILDLIAGVPMKAAVATSSYMIGITASAGSTVYFATGLIDPVLVALAILGIVLGSRTGASIMNRLRSRTLRLLFSVLLAYYSYKMIVKGLAAGGVI